MSLHEYCSFVQAGLMSVGHAPLNTHFQENLCVNPNSTRKRYPHLVFCIVGLKVDVKDHSFFFEFECMTSQFYARPHALICTCPKNGVPAPHSTSSPHLAQTEQVRLTRFFALPDSNTSQRVTISVLGHLAVSQMGIVQVPHATVTVKYLRALSIRYDILVMAC